MSGTSTNAPAACAVTRGHSARSRPERGAALLAALLTVALVATLATAGLWQQWRAVEVEAAERQRAQAAWILHGALDWTRLILREDAAAGDVDHLAEPWAVPLQEARLSTFLASDRNTGTAGTTIDQSFLSGEIVDLQSRLNLASLQEGARVSEAGLRRFQRLFLQLGLPAQQLDALAARWIQANQAPSGAPSTPDASPVPLRPWRVNQLTWLGVPASTVTALAPHVVILPVATPVNLNTASATVIAAAVEGISLADAQRLVTRRAGSPLRSLADAAEVLGRTPDSTAASVASRFFEVRGRLRLERLVIEERSLVQRDNGQVRVLLRERQAPRAAPPA